MALVEHAREELTRAGLFDEDSDYGGMLGTAVLELVEKFSEQGHSGYSAGMAVSLFTKVALYEPLTPLSGDDDEWNDVSDIGGRNGGELLQNKRHSSVFKDDGVCYDIDAVTVRDPHGGTWGARSRDPITFPYTPTNRVVEIDLHGRTLDRSESRFDVQGFCDDDGCNCWRGETPIDLE